MKYVYIYDFCYNGLLILMFLFSLLIIETNSKQIKNNSSTNSFNEKRDNNNQSTNQFLIDESKEIIKNEKSNGKFLSIKNIIYLDTDSNKSNFLEITNNLNLEQIPPTYAPNRYSLPNIITSNDQINASKLTFLNQFKKESSIQNLGSDEINNDLLNSSLFIDSLSRGALINSRYKVDSFPQVDTNNLSKKIKNIECIMKQGYLFYLKPRTPAHILFIDLGFSQNYSQTFQVMIILNSSFFQVLLNGTTEILKLGLPDIQAVKKSNSNNKCFNIFDNLNQMHKFCQIDNLPYNSSDNWVDEIIKFKSFCIFNGLKEGSLLANSSSSKFGSIFALNPFATNRYAKSIFDYNKSKMKPDNYQDNKDSYDKKKIEKSNKNIKKKNKNRNKLNKNSFKGKSVSHVNRIIEEEIETNINKNLNFDSINDKHKKNISIQENPKNLSLVDINFKNALNNSTQEFINENKEIENKNSSNGENEYNNDNNRNNNNVTINTQKILNNKRYDDNENSGNIQKNDEEIDIKNKTYDDDKILTKNKLDEDDNRISDNQTLNQTPLNKFKLKPKTRLESNSIIKSNFTSIVNERINNCFSKDPDIMIEFFKYLKENNSEYSNFYLSSISYCYVCCKSNFKHIQETNLRCCIERCDINSNNTLLVSLQCIKIHSDNFIKKNFLPQENFGNLPATKESLLIGTYKKTKENYSKIKKCFTKDIMKIQIYTFDILKSKKDLIPSEINKDNFCIACCKVEFDKDPRGKRCCEERCEIQQNKIKKISIFCLMPHTNMLKFENYITQK